VLAVGVIGVAAVGNAGTARADALDGVSIENSTFAVTPSGPLLVGESYTLTAYLEDESGVAVGGQDVTFLIEASEQCPLVYTGEQAIAVPTSPEGVAELPLEGTNSGTCEVAAFVGDWPEGDWEELDGSYVEVVWEWPPGPAADPSKSTVVITPSDATGRPVAVPTEGHYVVEVGAYAADGITPVPGAWVDFNLPAITGALRCIAQARPDWSAVGTPRGLGARTGADGILRAIIEDDPSYPPNSDPIRGCSLIVAVEEEILNEGDDPKSLFFLPPPNLDAEYSFYSVSAQDVAADGADSGFIELQVSSEWGMALADPAKLTASAAPGSGLAFGEFSEVPDEDSGSGFANWPTGLYRASFTGAAPGDWPVGLLYDGQPVAVAEDGAAVAHLVGTVASSLDLRVAVAHRCMAGRAYLNVTVYNDSDDPATLTIATPFGNKVFPSVAANTAAAQSFNSRAVSYGPGSASLTGASLTDPNVTGEASADYSGSSCV
jgi:hypothetical protein